MVVAYFHTYATAEKKENCVYKTITVCKGNCYVAKKIKIITSTPGNEKPTAPGFDIHSFKDATCITLSVTDLLNDHDTGTLSPVQHTTHLYSYTFTSHLIKPPSA